MKKLYTLIALAALATSAIAQNRVANPGVALTMGTLNSSVSTLSLPPTDTIWNTFLTPGWAGPQLQFSVGGGYVSGNNGYGDKEKAQSFISTGPTTIYGAIYWFGAKEVTSGNPNSVVQMRVYDMNGTGTISSGTGPAPNTVLRSDNVGFSLIDTCNDFSTPYIHTFSTVVNTSNDFAVGFGLTGILAGDTIGCVYSGDGEAQGDDESWDKWSDDTWHSFMEPNNWGIDVDLAIFPIVSYGSNIEELSFVGGVKITTYPNPAITSTTITYEFQNDVNNVEIKVLDATGKTVAVIAEDNQKAGRHNLSYDVSTLSAGTYYVTIKAGKGQIATVLVVE